ncbi:MAG: hypothetical protein CMM50_12170 [Rhodospirillaceae bacterium]|nr:hypothetical protein [Rhodospirillaceae bacterium]
MTATDRTARRLAVGLALALLVTGFPASGWAAPKTIAGSARVSDADVVVVRGARLRLDGIVPPKEGASCGDTDCRTTAESILEGLVGDSDLTCAVTEKIGHGYYMAVCDNGAGTADLGFAMIEAGWAQAMESASEDYVAAEARAREAGLGMWAFMVNE